MKEKRERERRRENNIFRECYCDSHDLTITEYFGFILHTRQQQYLHVSNTNSLQTGMDEELNFSIYFELYGISKCS